MQLQMEGNARYNRGRSETRVVLPKPRALVVRRMQKGVRLAQVGVVLGTIAAEALLAYRLWTQVTNESWRGLHGLAYGVSSQLVDLSSSLAEPFMRTQPAGTINDSGVFDLSTVVAMETYLVLALSSIAFLMVANTALWGLKQAAQKLSQPGESRATATPAPALPEFERAS